MIHWIHVAGENNRSALFLVAFFDTSSLFLKMWCVCTIPSRYCTGLTLKAKQNLRNSVSYQQWCLTEQPRQYPRWLEAVGSLTVITTSGLACYEICLHLAELRVYNCLLCYSSQQEWCFPETGSLSCLLFTTYASYKNELLFSILRCLQQQWDAVWDVSCINGYFTAMCTVNQVIFKLLKCTKLVGFWSNKPHSSFPGNDDLIRAVASTTKDYPQAAFHLHKQN